MCNFFSIIGHWEKIYSSWRGCFESIYSFGRGQSEYNTDPSHHEGITTVRRVSRTSELRLHNRQGTYMGHRTRWVKGPVESTERPIARHVARRTSVTTHNHFQRHELFESWPATEMFGRRRPPPRPRYPSAWSYTPTLVSGLPFTTVVVDYPCLQDFRQ